MALWKSCTYLCATLVCIFQASAKLPSLHNASRGEKWEDARNGNFSDHAEPWPGQFSCSKRSRLELQWSLVVLLLPPATTTHVVLVQPDETSFADVLQTLVPADERSLENATFSTASADFTLPKALQSTGISTTLLGCNANSVVTWASENRLILPRHTVMMLCSADVARETVRQIKQQFLESSYRQWLVFASDDITEYLLPVLTESTRMILVYCRQQGDGFVVAQSCVGPDTTMRFSDGIFWTTRGKRNPSSMVPVLKDSDSSYANFGGRELTVAHNNGGTYSLILNVNGTEIAGGIDNKLCEILAQNYNFTFRFVLPHDRLWGGLLPNGSVVGMIGMVARGEVHLAIDEIGISANRIRTVDYTNPYHFEETYLISRVPQRLSPAFSIVRPFTLKVWMAILVALLLGSVIVLFLAQLSPSATRISTEAAMREIPLYLFALSRVLLVQGNTLKAKTAATAVALLTWFIAAQLINTIYAGRLIAVLWRPLYERPIDSLVDLHRVMQERKMTLMMVQGTQTDQTFISAEDGIMKDLNAIKQYVTGKEFQESLIRSKISHVRITTKSFALQKTCHDRKAFHLGRAEGLRYMLGFAVPIGAPYRSLFSNLLQRLFEGGIVDHLVVQHFLNQPGCMSKTLHTRNKDSRDSPSEPLSFEHLQGAFILLCLGCLTGLLALIAEKLY